MKNDVPNREYQSTLSGAQRKMHQSVGSILKLLGFRWETRRLGDTQIGFWRRQWQTQRMPQRKPRRCVVTPGLGDSCLSWLPILLPLGPVLKKQFDELILIDFPGFNSFLGDHPPFSSIDQTFHHYAKLMDTLAPTVLIGHSLGGWLSADYAATQGEKRRLGEEFLEIEKILLFNPGGIVVRDDEVAQVRYVFDRAKQDGYSFYRPYLFHKSPIWFHLFGGSVTRFFSNPDIHAWFDSFREEDHMLNDRAQNIDAETWLVWSDGDKLNLPTWANDWLERVDRSKLVLLKGVGHCLHLENPLLTLVATWQTINGREAIPEPKVFLKRVLRPWVARVQTQLLSAL